MTTDRWRPGHLEDRRVIASNLQEGTKIAPVGALCYVVATNRGAANARIVVLIRSYGGRHVRKWEDMKRLGNFRVKRLPPEHPMYRDRRIMDFNEQDLDELLEACQAVEDSDA